MIHLCAKFMHHLPYNAWHHVKQKRHAYSAMVIQYTAGTVIIACDTDTEYI